VPKPVKAGTEGAALAALVEFCEQAGDLCTTQAAMQHFAGSAHEDALLAALTGGEQDDLSAELLEIQLVEGIKRYWMNVQKHGGAAEAGLVPILDLSPEETERARQRVLARHAGGP
jgi:hypothetical protein